jgi:exo-1,4-beta-D-glucosaminidase
LRKEPAIRVISVFLLAFLLACCSEQRDELSSRILLRDNWFIARSGHPGIPSDPFSGNMNNTGKWYRARVPSTVMGVLTSNGLYKDIFSGDNFSRIDSVQFYGPWLYSTRFSVPSLKGGQHISLHFDGINYSGNIWLNGSLLASRNEIKGPFRMYEFDITGLVHESGNILTVEVYRAEKGDFNLGFVDWNPKPPDKNMGIWREVYLKTTGEVSIENTWVRSSVNTETLKEASLIIRTSLKNHSPSTLRGILKGRIGGESFSYPVTVEAGRTIDLELGPKQISILHIKNPRLWWCSNLGSPEMYRLNLTFETRDGISDADNINFGIREISSYWTPEGHKGFRLNGKNVLIRGAGWADDIFLRDSIQSLESQVRYIRDMNLNTVRFENFWGTNQDIYDLCDKYGIMIMAGWTCEWEWEEYIGKPCDEFGGVITQDEMNLVVGSLRDQVLWLRNHPSVIVWLVGSDKCPRPELQLRYASLFAAEDNRPYLATAGTRFCPVYGPSGVKMNGPYEYVPPVYWYQDTASGGAFGFNTETGPGPQIPCLESLEKMIPKDKLWPMNETWNYHCTHSIRAFNTLEVFNEALENRYGVSGSLKEYLMKSDVQSYEALKAMFEAFRVNIPVSTGIIQWMMNSAWPKLYWQLYDYYLVPTSAYYAARTANKPVQLIYNYADNSVYAVNETLTELTDAKAHIKLLDFDSKLITDREVVFSVKPGSSVAVYKLEPLKEPVFLDLKLKNARGAEMALNFYWLSGKPDEMDWKNTNWVYTPVKRFADFTSLDNIPGAEVTVKYKIRRKGNNEVIRCRITNPSDKTAFFINLVLLDDSGNRTVPVFWSDNFINLLPGEKRDIECTADAALLKGKTHQVRITGWNFNGITIYPEK